MSLLMSEKPHILVIDDDQRLRELLERYLSGQNMIVLSANDAKNAMEKLKRFEFDLAIIDVMMPEEDGISLARRIRKIYPDMALMLLTALGEAESRIKGLEAGVDDYMAKPFEPKELLLRVSAILRRTKKSKPKVRKDIILGDYKYMVDKQILVNTAKNNETVALTTTEKQLLDCLVEKTGQVVSRDELANIGGISANSRSVDVQVTRLRKKIEKDSKNPRYLHTIRGKGYIIRPDE